jgi:hypothetical protein
VGNVGIAALALGLAVQTARIEGFLFIDGYKDKLAARDQKIADMTKASDEAWLLLIKQKADFEAKAAQIAKESNREDQAVRIVYRDRSDAYADRMRLDKVCSRNPAPAAQGGAPAVGDGPGPDAVVVARSDFNICTDNSRRIERVHNLGDEWIIQGLAVPQD